MRMGLTYSGATIKLGNGEVLGPATIVVETECVVYVDPVTGRYSRLISWPAINEILLK